ncbi:uncharacterized protein LOC127790799 [Diospyros lotus]|uniref:uncharacterized protein LOC127790799 n=1 Tax=Diospyros lotus TaxID=55363 RepID=UPI0022567610|nr:uncharacterized protein LOC127790799 [Diospyros lotus]
MGLNVEQEDGKKPALNISATLVEAFYAATATLLGLLLPLSFLLLARLSTANYLFTSSHSSQTQASFLFLFLFIYAIPTVLNALVSLVGVATLFHGLTGRITLIRQASSPDQPLLRPPLYTAWVLICALQVCIGLGIEGSVAAGINGSGFGHGTSLLSKVIFFLGLHESMIHWSRTIVKPVVDDTIFGFARDERQVERVAMAASFGALWWWRLRTEVDSLAAMVEVKKELSLSLGIADLIGWWLYYLTVIIGIIRIVKSIMWVGAVLLCRPVKANPDESIGNGEKV